jgi:hypothetical protein
MGGHGVGVSVASDMPSEDDDPLLLSKNHRITPNPTATTGIRTVFETMLNPSA